VAIRKQRQAQQQASPWPIEKTATKSGSLYRKSFHWLWDENLSQKW
jgi:hypothetical protein